MDPEIEYYPYLTTDNIDDIRFRFPNLNRVGVSPVLLYETNRDEELLDIVFSLRVSSEQEPTHPTIRQEPYLIQFGNC